MDSLFIQVGLKKIATSNVGCLIIPVCDVARLSYSVRKVLRKMRVNLKLWNFLKLHLDKIGSNLTYIYCFLYSVLKNHAWDVARLSLSPPSFFQYGCAGGLPLVKLCLKKIVGQRQKLRLLNSCQRFTFSGIADLKPALSESLHDMYVYIYIYERSAGVKASR